MTKLFNFKLVVSCVTSEGAYAPDELWIPPKGKRPGGNEIKNSAIDEKIPSHCC